MPFLMILVTVALTCGAVTLAEFVGGAATAALPISLLALVIMIVVAKRHAKSSSDLLNPFTLITAYSVLAYPIGGILYGVLSSRGGILGRFTPQSLFLAQVLGLLGWVGFAVGYLQRRITIPPIRDLWPAEGVPSAVRLAIVYAVGTAARLLVISQGRYFHIAASASDLQATSSSFLITTCAQLPTLVLILAMVNRKQGRRYPLLIFAVFIELAYAVPTGARGELLALIGSLIALRYYQRGKLPWLALVPAMALMVFVIFPFVLAFRGNDATYSQQLESSSQRALSSTFEGGASALLSNGGLAFFTRFSDSTSAAAVFQSETQEVVGFPRRYPEAALATVLVPRALLPRKSDPGLYGNAFGRSFGFSYRSDFVTSINVPHATEFYLGYGWLGVALFMPVVGLAYRWINENLPRRIPSSRAIYCLLILVIPQTTENILALGFFGLLKTLIVYAFMVRFVWHRRPSQAGVPKPSSES